jgi:hypothetical protein
MSENVEIWHEVVRPVVFERMRRAWNDGIAKEATALVDQVFSLAARDDSPASRRLTALLLVWYCGFKPDNPKLLPDFVTRGMREVPQ